MRGYRVDVEASGAAGQGAWPGRLLGYVLALAATGLAVLATGALEPLIGPRFAVFFVAVMLAAWRGGLGPGLLATLLSVAAFDYFFLPPVGVLNLEDPTDLVLLAVYGGAATLISFLSGRAVAEARRARVAAEEASRAREQLQAILDGVADGIIALDPAERLVFANEAAARAPGFPSATALLGASREEVLGRFEIMDAAGQPLPPERLPSRRALRGEPDPVEVVRFRVRATGEERWAQVSARPLRDSAGRVRLAIAIFVDISERMRAEAALREANDTLRAIIEASPLAIMALDPEGRVRLWNPAAQRILGWAADEVLGRPLPAIPDDRQEEFRANLRRTMEEGTIVGMETRRQRKDGELIEVALWAAPLRDAEGRPIGVLSLVADIGERKREERAQRLLAAAGEALAASLDIDAMLERLVRLLVSSLADYCLLYLLDEQGALVAGPAAHRHPEREALLRRAAPLYRPDPANPASIVAQVLATGRSVLVPEVPPDTLAQLVADPALRREFSALEPRSCIVVPLVARGSVLGALALVASDTARRFDERDLALAEELARRAALALDNARLHHRVLASEAEARALYRAALAIGAEPDLSARLERVLEAALELTGGRHAVIGLVNQAAGAVEYVAARGEPIYTVGMRQPLGTGLVGQVIAEGRPLRVPDLLAEPRAYDVALVRQAGVCGWLGVPLADSAGVLGVLAVLSQERSAFGEEDERRLLSLAALAGAAIREARLREQALEAVRARDDFLTSVSHDLRNPLASIKAHADLLHRRATRSSVPEAQAMAPSLAQISARVSRMAAQLQQLLDLARLEIGQPLDLQRELTDLAALARRVVEEALQTAGRHAVRVEAAGPLVGNWDPARLERVLTNLLDNAIKYSPAGGEVVVSVESEGSGPEAWAVLRVRDRGIGIPADDLPRVFERFHRGANVAGRIPGTGLGLAGAKQIVEQHGGSIAVESQEGQGTTVTVRLPLGVATGASPGRPEPQGPRHG